MSEQRQVRVVRPVYGGDLLSEDGALALPFVLPGEVVELGPDNSVLRVVRASRQRVEPRCPHFGVCGGCQYQMMAADGQTALKREVLRGLLMGLDVPGEIVAHAGEPYGYRNRIRLRVERVDGMLRFGYNVRGTTTFLPIVTCPIAAPVLWETAEAMLRVSAANLDAAMWLDAATEVELFADAALAKVQVTLFCPPRTRVVKGSFAKMMQAIAEAAPVVVGGSAIAVDPRTGPTGRTFDSFGAAGLNYQVGEERYWISRGGFFQVNRFLLPTLVRLVTEGRHGELAWDLFAGVGLFSRVLAKRFAQVTAVEANPTAAADLANALRKLGPQHRAVTATTLEFLRRAVLERERPELIVLDPPRAGAGEEACELLCRLRARTIVYVSCDPTTLARDWKALAAGGYRSAAVHLVDLFPQTFHLESVVVFERGS